MLKNEYKNGYYQGQMNDGKRHGLGIFLWDNGLAYFGEWFQDNFEGEGLIQIPTLGFIQAQFKNNKLHGSSYFVGKSELLRFAKYQFGRLEGKSIQMTQNQEVQSVSYSKGIQIQIQDKPDEQEVEVLMDSILSKLSSIDELILRNPFDEYSSSHFGYLELPHGQMYLGSIENDAPNGLGIINSLLQRFTRDATFEISNSDIYTGNFKQAQMSGLCTQFKPNGDVYIGLMESTLRNGIGLCFIQFSKKWHLGQFEKGSCEQILKSMDGIFEDFEMEALKIGLLIHSRCEIQEKIKFPIQFLDEFSQQTQDQETPKYKKKNNHKLVLPIQQTQLNVFSSHRNDYPQTERVLSLEIPIPTRSKPSSKLSKPENFVLEQFLKINDQQTSTFQNITSGQTTGYSTTCQRNLSNNYNSSTQSSKTKTKQKYLLLIINSLRNLEDQSKIKKRMKENQWNPYVKDLERAKIQEQIKDQQIPCKQEKAQSLYQKSTQQNSLALIKSLSKDQTSDRQFLIVNVNNSVDHNKTNSDNHVDSLRLSYLSPQKYQERHSSFSNLEDKNVYTPQKFSSPPSKEISLVPLSLKKQIQEIITNSPQVINEKKYRTQEYFHLNPDISFVERISNDLEDISEKLQKYQKYQSISGTPIKSSHNLTLNNQYLLDQILEHPEENNLPTQKHSTQKIQIPLQGLQSQPHVKTLETIKTLVQKSDVNPDINFNIPKGTVSSTINSSSDPFETTQAIRCRIFLGCKTIAASQNFYADYGSKIFQNECYRSYMNRSKINSLINQVASSQSPVMRVNPQQVGKQHNQIKIYPLQQQSVLRVLSPPSRPQQLQSDQQ